MQKSGPRAPARLWALPFGELIGADFDFAFAIGQGQVFAAAAFVETFFIEHTHLRQHVLIDAFAVEILLGNQNLRRAQAHIDLRAAIVRALHAERQGQAHAVFFSILVDGFFKLRVTGLIAVGAGGQKQGGGQRDGGERGMVFSIILKWDSWVSLPKA